MIARSARSGSSGSIAFIMTRIHRTIWSPLVSRKYSGLPMRISARSPPTSARPRRPRPSGPALAAQTRDAQLLDGRGRILGTGSTVFAGRPVRTDRGNLSSAQGARLRMRSGPVAAAAPRSWRAPVRMDRRDEALAAEVDIALRRPRSAGELTDALQRITGDTARLATLAEELPSLGTLGSSVPDAVPVVARCRRPTAAGMR
ncbi:MAG: sensor histidine kinase [Solirubrobacterales bacterium]|nr:sensor histidine kinase [Solirubrobacterales bacterium]